MFDFSEGDGVRSGEANEGMRLWETLCIMSREGEIGQRKASGRDRRRLGGFCK